MPFRSSSGHTCGSRSAIGLRVLDGVDVAPTQRTVVVLRRHNRHLQMRRLPVSWRPPASAAPEPAEALAFTCLHGSTSADKRALSLSAARFGGRRWACWWSLARGGEDGSVDWVGAVSAPASYCRPGTSGAGNHASSSSGPR